MNVLLFLLILTLCVAIIATAGMLLLAWVAKGEPDVNGDPERDAGDNIEERGFFRVGTSYPEPGSSATAQMDPRTMAAVPKSPNETQKEFSRSAL